VGTESLTGLPGRTGAVLLVSGGTVVFLVPSVVGPFDDGFTGTADVVREEMDADEGPAAVCCRPPSASLVLSCR
jgi:hypothetical protein